VISQDDKIAS